MIPHRVKQLTIERLVKEETRNWPREMKLLAQLSKEKDDPRFWGELNLGFQLHSLAWFKLPDGAAELEKHWRLHQMTLDKPANPAILPDIPVEAPQPRQNALTWASE